MNTQWNAEVVTPVEEGAGTKVLDNQSNVQPTLEAGSNITIANGEISATGGGAEYTAGSGISINNNTISVDSDIRSGAAAGATAVQAADLATVATSGSYNDLSNTPTIPTVDQSYSASSANAQSGVAVAGAISGKQDTISDLDTIRSGAALGATAVQASQLATVATSGSYNDLSNKPTIPAAQVQSDWNQTNDQAVDFIKNKPTIPAGVVVDQSYSASSTNAQSGTAVAEALATVNQVPASTSADEDKVLTVDSNGDAVWATAQSGSSYTFSAPLNETSGTVGLDVDTDNLMVATKTTTVSAQREISAANNGYAWYLGNIVGDTSDTVYTFTFNNVPVPSDVDTAVVAQGEHIYPMLVGETYGSWGNQWIIPTALTFNSGNRTVSGSFSVCFKSGEQDYPTHLDSYGQLSWASVLVFVVASDVPSAQVSTSNIYGTTTSGSSVSYSTGGSMLMVKNPVPAVTSGDNGKVLGVTDTSGTLGWVAQTPAQVNSDWNASSGVSQILNKPTLATVATSGSYADLSNKPTIPTVDQTYNASSTNAQSGTAVAGALATVNQVPASTSADEDKVLTVDSNGDAVWATAQSGSSYTFSAPLRESSGTVVLDVDTDNLKVAVKTTTLSMQYSMSGAANNGYGLYVGNLVTDTSGTVYTFTFDHVPVPSDVSVGVQSQGKKLYPLLVGQTYGDYGNQWIIPTALTLDYEGKVNGSFSVCFKPGEQDYPTSLTSGANLNYVAALVFVLSDMSGNVPSTQVNPSSIYGSTTSGSSVNYSTGGSMLMVKYPLPAPSVGDAGKVLAVNSGATGVEWINSVPIEVVAALPANPTSGTLYIVTGS